MPDVGEAGLVLTHGRPAPRGESDRLQHRGDRGLVRWPVAVAERADGFGGAEVPPGGGEQLGDVQPAGKLARGGHRRVKRTESGGCRGLELRCLWRLRQAEVLRAEVAVGDAGVVQGAQRTKQGPRLLPAHRLAEWLSGRQGQHEHE